MRKLKKWESLTGSSHLRFQESESDYNDLKKDLIKYDKIKKFLNDLKDLIDSLKRDGEEVSNFNYFVDRKVVTLNLISEYYTSENDFEQNFSKHYSPTSNGFEIKCKNVKMLNHSFYAELNFVD